MIVITFVLDRRESSTNPTTTIVSVDLCENDITGKNLHLCL